METTNSKNNMFKNLLDESIYTFDYEINEVKFIDKNKSDGLIFFNENMGYSKNYGMIF